MWSTLVWGRLSFKNSLHLLLAEYVLRGSVWECNTMSRRLWAESRASWKMSLYCGWWTRYEDTKSPWGSLARPCPWLAILERWDEFTQKKDGGVFKEESSFVRKLDSERSRFSVDFPSCSHSPRHMVWPWCHLTRIDMPQPEAVKQVLGYDGGWEGCSLEGYVWVMFSSRHYHPSHHWWRDRELNP